MFDDAASAAVAVGYPAFLPAASAAAGQGLTFSIEKEDLVSHLSYTHRQNSGQLSQSTAKIRDICPNPPPDVGQLSQPTAKVS